MQNAGRSWCSWKWSPVLGKSQTRPFCNQSLTAESHRVWKSGEWFSVREGYRSLRLWTSERFCDWRHYWYVAAESLALCNLQRINQYWIWIFSIDSVNLSIWHPPVFHNSLLWYCDICWHGINYMCSLIYVMQKKSKLVGRKGSWERNRMAGVQLFIKYAFYWFKKISESIKCQSKWLFETVIFPKCVV